MQLRLSFPTLLASVLLASYSAQDIFINARPLARNTGPVTLPLQRVAQRNGSHPHVYLQQHINRSNKRLARMTGRQLPSDHELGARILKRIADIEDQGNVTHGLRLTRRQISLPLVDEGLDVGYHTIISVGTPPRDFTFLADSGSADTWVGAEDCQIAVPQTGSLSRRDGGCGNHTLLGSQSSSSFKDTGNPFQVTYGTGAVAGTIVTDDITVAGLTLKEHTFGVAHLETLEFSSSDTPFDGLMGLAQSIISNQKVLTPVEALAKQGLIPKATVSYKIPREADNKHDGEITFGGSDESKFDSSTQVEFANVNKQGFWEGELCSVTVDGQDTQLQGRTAILDTGTTLIIAPPQDAQAVHALITGAQSDGNGGFYVPCNFNQIVALSFGGRTFEIDPRDILFGGGPVAQDPQTGELFCQSGISEGSFGGGPTAWLVGDVFLKNAYFSTNFETNTMSLAKLV